MNVIASDRGTPSEESDYSDDDECIDILDGHASPASEEHKEDGSCDGVSGGSKFSIDSILGLRNECKSDEEKTDEKMQCVREGKFIKPTPIPAIPRGE